MSNTARPDRRPVSFHHYSPGGQLMLFATRHWMRAYRRRRSVPPCVWQSFSAAGLERAYAQLCELLAIVVFREFPPRGFARPDSGKLTGSEQCFMSVLHALESGDALHASSMLEGVASPAVTRAIIDCADTLVGTLNARGHQIARSPGKSRANAQSVGRTGLVAATVH